MKVYLDAYNAEFEASLEDDDTGMGPMFSGEIAELEGQCSAAVVYNLHFAVASEGKYNKKAFLEAAWEELFDHLRKLSYGMVIVTHNHNYARHIPFPLKDVVAEYTSSKTGSKIKTWVYTL